MTSTAALPGADAVLRMVRGTAGRCPVRVALLVGGLFVLGVLCGARASATEGTPTSPPLPAAVTAAATEVTGTAAHAPQTTDEPAVARHTVQRHMGRPVTERVVRPVTDRVARPVTEDVVERVADPVSLSRPVAEDVLRPLAESVLRPVIEHVVVPVGDLVESVTEGLAGVRSQLPPVTGVPSLPGMPGLPEVPELPAWTTLPVGSLPVVVTPQEPGRAGAERPGSTVDGDSGSGRERASGPASVVYGPDAAVGGAVAVSALHRDAGAGDAPVVRVPAQHSPDGLPTSALGLHSTVDNGGPRHAEPQAAASPDRAPLSLVPGAPAADVANGTRDRHGDIPEFPG
ncbi:hypothetical protein [Streptomyces europaeiscabiei]|uniref:hypothetical protein n=1 Tax=Streptomyces europaeiscabiei TaxID=146819 RepID=UPI0029A5AFC9|nr:hypothetical protein [Streptomyces europaeiscabiei]MDX2773064.1 hypothetical protein [Streptomyces europaeiscabiei]